MDDILGYALRFALIFPAIVLHEIAHGYVAYLLGDDTAKRAGRLSLNPFRHVDPMGTVILPIAMIILTNGAYFFGWAKPVPINPHGFSRLRRKRSISAVPGPYSASPEQDAPDVPPPGQWGAPTDPVFGGPSRAAQPKEFLPTGDARWAQRLGMALTGAAGPITNIVLAIIAGLGVRFMVPIIDGSTSLGLLATILLLFARANLVLAFFNLVPIPPLDGSRIFQFFLPDAARDAYHRIEQYGFLILIASTWIFPGILGTYLSYTVLPILELLTGLR